MKKVALALMLLALPSRAHALQTDELLSLIAMPLAVAAVADVAGVPLNELQDVLALLNQADVPPVQFIETVRFIPVALVADPPKFVEFVRARTNEGIRGDALVVAIQDRIRVIAPDVQLNVTAPRSVIVDDNFVPPVVRTFVVKRRGPARVVVVQPERRIEVRERDDDDDDDHGGGHGRGRGRGHGRDGDGGGKGKGKGKGKD